MKRYGGQLTLFYANGCVYTINNVVNFNLVEGILYIWVIRFSVFKVSLKLVCKWYYAYTPY